jgi:hypothetical protein
MADLHIDDFYRDCARVLHQLYQAFPRKVTVFVEDIIGHDEPDEFGMHSRRHHACFAAMLWLADEGHLRYESVIRQEAIDQAVLTGSMFALLCGAPPAKADAVSATDFATSVANGVANGTPGGADSRVLRIRAALQAQSSFGIERVMRELMSVAAGQAVATR